MNLRSDMRQKNTQLNLDFHSAPAGEPRQATGEATESLPTIHAPESPASTHQLMKEVCERENLKQALQQVKVNKGSPGIDGMTVEELPGYLQQHWPTIREQLLNGTYEPKPVRRVEIEKPDGGGMRKLGIPTVLDRFVQQAVMQVLQRQWDPTFSDHSYGSDRDGRLIKPWPRRRSISPRGTAGWWTSIWKNSWIHLHNAPLFMK
jgi:RNA-directed DNA polymerase